MKMKSSSNVLLQNIYINKEYIDFQTSSLLNFNLKLYKIHRYTIIQELYKTFTFRCIDQIQIYPHLKEPVIQKDSSIPEDTICDENSYLYSATKEFIGNIYTASEPNVTIMDTNRVSPFRIRNRKSFYSSDRILGIRITFETINKIVDITAFNISGKFQFIARGKC